MNNKYYVTCGENKLLILASNPIKASILCLQRITKPIGKIIRISQRGFSKHEDDIILTTKLILKIILFLQHKSKD